MIGTVLTIVFWGIIVYVCITLFTVIAGIVAQDSEDDDTNNSKE